MNAALITISYIASQAPGPVQPSPVPGVDWVTGLLDRGPLGLSAILMAAIWWLFKHYEKKAETTRKLHEEKIDAMRDEFKKDYDAIRDSNTELLIRAIEVVVENNTLLARIVPILERGER